MNPWARNAPRKVVVCQRPQNGWTNTRPGKKYLNANGWPCYTYYFETHESKSQQPAIWQAGAALMLVWGLIVLAFIDLDTQYLPDDVTLPLLWLGLLVNLAGAFVSLPEAVTGAVAGYLTLWLVYHLFRLLTGKEGMGHGDFKLLAALGAWFGWIMLPLIILASSLVGAVIGIAMILFAGHDRSRPIPFGPYLVLAGLIALFWGRDLLRLYLGG